MNNR